jgi:hypothetical protein
MNWTGKSSAIGHLVYIFIPTLYTGLAVLHIFRYSTNSDYYTRFVADSSQSIDWFKIGDYISNWGGLVLWGLAWLTSILALFGGAALVDLNMIIWVWGIGLGNSLAMLTSFVMKFFAFDTAYDKYETVAVAPTAYNNILTEFAI